LFRSLTARAILASFIWIAIALGLGGWAISELFRDSTTRQFDANLKAHLELLSAAVASSSANPGSRMTNPDFERVYSGAYWQVSAEGETLFRSRSLWDTELPPFQPQPDGADTVFDTVGPAGDPIRMATRLLVLPDRGGVDLSVALDVEGLHAEIAQFGRRLVYFAALFCCLLLAAAMLLLRAAFAPLKTLQQAVADRHANHAREIEGEYPQELAELVVDLNSLLARNERLRDKGQVQAANLAHALKTPAAILRNELAKARRGDAIDLEMADQAVENVSAFAERHLSLAAAAPQDLAAPSFSDPAKAARDVTSALQRVFPAVEFAVLNDGPQRLPIAHSETVELFGNLVENAAKWTRSEVRIEVGGSGRMVTLSVQDDGPGVAPEDRDEIVKQGVRLDTSRGGSGLGLTIVSDILERHGGEMQLSQSALLGGLEVKLLLPSA
jgi:signal transduction histidine kinase